jgi:hypothetical protein
VFFLLFKLQTMLFCEINAWLRWAAPESLNTVVHAAVDAMDAWPMCGNPDLAPLCRPIWVWPIEWSEAAAQAAAEMAIVCHIWPDSLDEVLRPARI